MKKGYVKLWKERLMFVLSEDTMMNCILQMQEREMVGCFFD
jgi:hypothetical protein